MTAASIWPLELEGSAEGERETVMDRRRLRNQFPAVITDHQSELEELCREFGIERLELFGSAASGEFDPNHSDLDFLVQYPDGFDLGPWMRDFFRFQEALKSLFGRNVDLIFLDGIRNPYFRRNIESTRTLLYAA
jgi:predicted nucleotidyltransferase